MSHDNTRQLIEIVGEALGRPAAEREAYLRKACPDGASLAEAMSLLASLARAGGFMDSPTQARSKLSARAGLSAGVAGEGAGSVIGRYTLLEQIGEGGFGVVYLAEQGEPVRRRVALKVIKPGMDTAEVVARFEAERQALAIMDHPNIAKVFDGGVTPSGRPYVVMEFVPGEPITAYCDHHASTSRERLALFVTVCAAVQHAHTKGILHRDLKPSNILVTMDGDRAVPKVIDFGVAKAIGHGITEKSIFTATGQLIGTPEYMSPEQAEMGAIDVDTRSDVYSLGVVLYELLTGSTPLAGAELRSKGYGEIQRIIREVDPPAPSTRLSSGISSTPAHGGAPGDPFSKDSPVARVARLRSTDPASLSRIVRGELDWIVMKALDKDRTRRYGTAESFAADVRNYLSGDPVVAAPVSAAYRARKFVRRNRGPVLASALVSLALVAGIAGTTTFALRESTARGRAERAEADERKRADELDRVARFQSSRLGDIDPAGLGVRWRENLLVEARAAEKRLGNSDEAGSARAAAIDEQLSGINFTNVALDGLDAGVLAPTLAAIRKEFADQPAVRAQLLLSAGDTMRRLGLDERALPVIQEACEVARSAYGERDARTLGARSLLGYMLRRAGKLDDAEREVRATLAVARESLGDRDRVTLVAMQYLSDVLDDQGKHAEAEKMYRETLNAERRALGDGDDRDVMQALSGLAESLFRQERLSESESVAREALGMCRRLEGADHPSTLTKMNNLASVLNAEKKFDEGIAMLREVVATSRRVFGDNHPDVATKVNNLGAALLSRRDYAEAEPLLIEGVERLRRSRGPTHPSTLSAINNLAYVYYFQGQFDRAAAALARGVRLTDGGGAGILQSRAVLLHHQAEALLKAGKAEEASGPAEQAWNLYRAHPDWNADESFHSARVFRDALLTKPDLDRAALVMTEAIEIERGRQPVNDDRLAVALGFQGATLITAKRYADAEAPLRECLALRQRLYPDGNPEAWLKYRTMTQIGSVLVAQTSDTSADLSHTPEWRSARFREAESLLTDAYQALKSDPKAPPSTPTSGPAREAQQGLVRLYDAWDAVEPGKGYDEQSRRLKGE